MGGGWGRYGTAADTLSVITGLRYLHESPNMVQDMAANIPYADSAPRN